ncbi:MAG TPA: leishmanolysin-related zinc metalloendopeptidase [Longimicrobium sp.]|nr:leishmanolysin-related zinc metalloendopeptidase [Longimicrobium sp.]
MRKLLLCSTAALALWGCSGDGGTEAKVATSVAVTPGSINFDALGATQVVHAAVLDQHGTPIAGVPVTWSAGAGVATVTGLGGDSATVTSVGNGSAAVTASTGSVSGNASVTVAQVAVQVQKFSGDTQTGTINGALAVPVRVKLVDRLGQGIAGKTVSFAVTTGGGSLSAASAVTEADGTAAVTWTLGGNLGAQSVTATFAGAALTPAVFTATAVAENVGSVSPATGNTDVAAMVNTAVSPLPAVVVHNNAGQPIAGVTVTFAPAAGSSTLTGAVATTDASGVARLGGWTIGAAGPNTVTATVNAAGFMGNPVTFRAVGCQGGGGAGYAITLCFTSTMSTSQRTAFEAAAARWAGIITTDVGDVPANIDANACDDGTPTLNLNIDDLVIFASVVDIDGPGAILGQAGWCIRRTAGLPLLGVMQFDAADVAGLESHEQFGSVILHEMGHVLGIGTMWSALSLLNDPAPSPDPWYSGAGGQLGFDHIGGSTYTGGQKVPVENTGGGGTANSHWRESVLKNELMTGFLNAGTNPLSELTVRSLADLGYGVNAAAADPFFLTLSLRASRSGAADAALDLGDDVYHGPRYTLDRAGRRYRLPSQ